MTALRATAVGRLVALDNAGAAAAALVVMEALSLSVLVILVPRSLGADAEHPAVWGAFLAVIGGTIAAKWLGGVESMVWRWTLGAVGSVLIVHVIGTLDLGEAVRIWDFGWLPDLLDFGGPAWQRTGSADHLLSGMMLGMAWTRGAWLGSGDLGDRRLLPTALFGASIFVIGFIGGDDAGVQDSVRILVLLYVPTALATVAFRNAARIEAAEGGSLRISSSTFAAALGATLVVALIVMLLVTVIVASIGGTGVAEPVTDVLDMVLNAVAVFIAWLIFPLAWVVNQLVGLINFSDPPSPVIEDARPQVEGRGANDSRIGFVTLLARIFGGIGLVLAITVLVVIVFRRLRARQRTTDESRESIWHEADLAGGLGATLRALRPLFPQRRRHGGEPIALLYSDLLAHAAKRGTLRAPARTPLQFAPVLQRTYGSAVPVEISEQFSTYRYAGRTPDGEVMQRLRTAWHQLKAER